MGSHQVLIAQDNIPIVKRKRLPRCAIHRSRAITVDLEEHDRGRAETGGV
jgi:hypothetical protein